MFKGLSSLLFLSYTFFTLLLGLEIGSYTVPTPLRIMTNYASKLVRSANVIELQLEKLAIYETVPSVYRQRALSTLSAIDISILWKPEGFQKPLNETEVRSLVQRMHTRLEPLNSNDSAPPALQVKQLLKELLSCLEMTIKNLCQCLASQHKSTSKSEHRILASHLELQLEIINRFVAPKPATETDQCPFSNTPIIQSPTTLAPH